MEQARVLIEAACATVPEIVQRMTSSRGGQRTLRDLEGDLIQVSTCLSEYMLRSEISKYRSRLIVLRDQGQLRGSTDLEKQWIACLHLQTSQDLYEHVQTLSQSRIDDLFTWVKHQVNKGGSPPPNPVQLKGKIHAVDLVDTAFESLTQYQLVEFMAKSLE